MKPMPRIIKAGGDLRPPLHRVHNCSLCEDFTVENRGLCFGCLMGLERKATGPVEYRASTPQGPRGVQGLNSTGENEHGNERSAYDESAKRRAHSA